jgi:hypothetical protein
LSYALREAILIIELLKEIRSHGHIWDTPSSHMTKVHCKVFEDNRGGDRDCQIPKVSTTNQAPQHQTLSFSRLRGPIWNHHPQDQIW